MGQQRARAVARRKAKLKGRDHDRATRRARLERILALLGLKDWCRQLLEDALDQLCRHFNPGPRVVPDPSNHRDRDLADRAKALQRELDGVTLRVGNVNLSFNDYHSVVMMLLRLFRMGGSDRTLGDFLREPAAAVDEFTRRHDDSIWNTFRSRVRCSLAEASGIDTAIYSARQALVPSGGRTNLTLTLRRTPVPSRVIVADGVGRRAYRCGAFHDLDSGEIDWVEWDARALGLGDAGKLPVYVQSHALHQLRDRLAIKPEHLIHYTLCHSLEEPVLVPASGGTYLVEYRFLEHKLGYFVAERLQDLILVRTFLLVTMQGTPEGSEFCRRLRLRRPDIEYLGLDQLGTLVATDMARDPEISWLLRDCGCGGALDFAPKVQSATFEGYAARFRDYTGTALERLSYR